MSAMKAVSQAPTALRTEQLAKLVKAIARVQHLMPAITEGIDLTYPHCGKNLEVRNLLGRIDILAELASECSATALTIALELEMEG